MRNRVEVHPGNIQAALDRASAGDSFCLSGARYPDPLTLSGRSGSPSRPVILHGHDAVIGPQISFSEYRRTANELSKRQEDNGAFPGLYYLADNAALIVRDCQWIILEDLRFEGCWPTAIYFDNCQNVIVRNVRIRGGTFAICATGDNTRHLLVERCSWIQDTSGKGEADVASIIVSELSDPAPPPAQSVLWNKTLWTQVHGAARDGFPVQVDTDARAFDGDFFRAWKIAGYVVIRQNIIVDAFNAIHFFNDAPADRVQDYCKNVLIEGNWFVRIRDNAVEPENHAWNWTIRHNKFLDCYIPFSFEMASSGHFYVYGNLGWGINKPGPDGEDHANGQLFKFPDNREIYGPHYVFNNTWFIKASVAKKKRFAGFHHFNNAIAFREPGGISAIDPPNVFGSQWLLPDDPLESAESVLKSEEKRFTKRWMDLQITFEGDRMEHPNFPDAYRLAGYPIGSTAAGGQLTFADHAPGEPRSLRLVDPPLATSYDVVLADGRSITPVRSDTVIGAWQGDDLISLNTCSFESLWPGEEFESISAGSGLTLV